MSHTTMSIPAIYKYEKDVNNVDIFEFLTVPTGVDRDALIDWILHRSAAFEATYPDGDYLHYAIGTWSKVHQRTMQKWFDALSLEYNPLHNYDRTEEGTDNGLVSRHRGNRSNSTALGSASDNTRSDTTTTEQVSAFDSASFSDSGKTITGTGTTNSNSNMLSRTGDDKEQESALDTRQHKLRAFGNIGVTTSMQLIESELSLDEWNLYEHITDLFLDEFCVLLY